jgi:hypothetical protein
VVEGSCPKALVVPKEVPAVPKEGLLATVGLEMYVEELLRGMDVLVRVGVVLVPAEYPTCSEFMVEIVRKVCKRWGSFAVGVMDPAKMVCMLIEIDI